MEYDKLDLVQNKANKLLVDLKNDSESSYASYAQLILVVLYAIVLVYLFIMDIESSATKYLIFSVILIGLVIFRRMQLGGAIRECSNLSNYKNIDPEDKQAYTSGMLKYLSSGYNVKIVRLSSLRLFYTLIFPLFLVLAKELYEYLSNDNVISTNILHYLLAFLIGSTFWYFFFQSDLEELKLDKIDVDAMARKVYS